MKISLNDNVSAAVDVKHRLECECRNPQVGKKVRSERRDAEKIIWFSISMGRL
jgi:hypothetical protein